MRLIAIIFCILIFGCHSSDKHNQSKSGSVYVKPSIDKNGKYRKGHIRKSVSTSKDAIKNQNRSQYYYQTRGKYRRKNN
jgi:hypothetical protein